MDAKRNTVLYCTVLYFVEHCGIVHEENTLWEIIKCYRDCFTSGHNQSMMICSVMQVRGVAMTSPQCCSIAIFSNGGRHTAAAAARVRTATGTTTLYHIDTATSAERKKAPCVPGGKKEHSF